MTRPLDILALGEAMIELNQQNDGRYLVGFGGDTSNMAIAAARLGARAGYLSQIGDDRFGLSLIDLWKSEGVAVEGVRMIPGASTGLYFVHHDADGHSFDYRRAGSAASLMTPESLPLALIEQAGWLHVSAISQAISSTARATVAAALARAHAAGTRISYDTNLRLRLWPLEEARAVILDTVPACDLLKTSIEDAELLLGKNAPEAITMAFLARGASAVAVTCGKQGAVVATASACVLVPGLNVAAVDATGAGDCFTGALITELQRGSPLADAARFANAAAALATLGYGAIRPLPNRAAVTAALNG